ncbi:MAG: tRNA 2-selenouridine(34) synthase MnmH [Porticoccaceae bacterium]
MNHLRLPSTAEYQSLLLGNIPMIDVRAPIEFITGGLPFATNLPFIVDDERQEIGICFKEKGQEAALALGHKRVNGIVKNQRVEAWQLFLVEHPNAVLYCARGGLRSQLSQQWLADVGITCPRIEGGYKSLRAFMQQSLVHCCETQNFVLLSGMTGTGKTDIIKSLDISIDLEGAANHKGSSFGRPLGEQPAQIDFENQIILDLMQVQHKYPERSIIIEDESRNIGGRHLPQPLTVAMAESPMVVIDLPFEERIDKLWQEYVIERYQQTMAYHQESGEQIFADYLIDSLLRVKKRLGGERTKEILALMEGAIKSQHQDQFASHRDWLGAITADYYDPMYLYQLDKRKHRIAFRGNHQEVIQWLHEKQ